MEPYYAISSQMLKQDENGKAVEGIYETNYFCAIISDAVNKNVTISFLEWDTDPKHAKRFISKTRAKNFCTLHNVTEYEIVLHPRHPDSITNKTKQNEHLRISAKGQRSNTSPAGSREDKGRSEEKAARLREIKQAKDSWRKSNSKNDLN